MGETQWEVNNFTGSNAAIRTLESCADTAAGNWVGIIGNFIGLIPALVGTMTRMRFNADANVQKALGMTADSIGSLASAYTMYSFGVNCYTEIDKTYTDDDGTVITIDKALGPGFWCFMVVLCFAFSRAVLHWLTPTPGLGAGCCQWKTSESLNSALEHDEENEACCNCRRCCSLCCKNKPIDQEVISAAELRERNLQNSKWHTVRRAAHNQNASNLDRKGQDSVSVEVGAV